MMQITPTTNNFHSQNLTTLVNLHSTTATQPPQNAQLQMICLGAHIHTTEALFDQMYAGS